MDVAAIVILWSLTIKQPLSKVAEYQVINLKKNPNKTKACIHVYSASYLTMNSTLYTQTNNLGETTGGYYYIGDL